MELIHFTNSHGGVNLISVPSKEEKSMKAYQGLWVSSLWQTATETQEHKAKPAKAKSQSFWKLMFHKKSQSSLKLPGPCRVSFIPPIPLPLFCPVGPLG